MVRRSGRVIAAGVVSMFLSVSGASAAEKTLKLATTDWCPYTCETSSSQKGFVVEYLKQIFKKRHIELDVQWYPWSRAIDMVKQGKADGLLTAAASEAEGLLATTTPTGNYKVCFYTRTSSKWMFKDAKSLEEIRLGVIADYSYGEPVDAHVKKYSQSEKVTVFRSSKGLPGLFELLAGDRIGATLDDKSVVEWVASKGGMDLSQFRMAGCEKSVPYFMAFHPGVDGVKDLIATLNKDLAAAENHALYERLMGQYAGKKR